MGPSVKIVSPNKGLISKKKWGSIFFVGKMPKPGGGGGAEGGLAKDHTFSRFFFLNPSLRSQYQVEEDYEEYCVEKRSYQLSL